MIPSGNTASAPTHPFERLALLPDLLDDGGQGLRVGAVLAQPDAQGQGVRVQTGVQQPGEVLENSNIFK